MDAETKKQIFLGGTCGRSTWRRRIAIPALEAAGLTYFDPQLGIGEWTPARESIEMQAKANAEVLLFVIGAETRGVASIGEVAYLLGSRRPLALAVTDIGESDRIDGELLTAAERDDLNRGRIFVRSMALQEGVPVFAGVESAVRYAIDLFRADGGLSADRLRAILEGVRFKESQFLVEETANGFLIQMRCDELDAATGLCQTYYGRKWHIAASADESDAVRTAFMAAVTWQEHEAREAFTYRGVPVFGPHSNVADLARLLTGKSGSHR
jgi:hypothetical protein